MNDGTAVVLFVLLKDALKICGSGAGFGEILISAFRLCALGAVGSGAHSPAEFADCVACFLFTGASTIGCQHGRLFLRSQGPSLASFSSS